MVAISGTTIAAPASKHSYDTAGNLIGAVTADGSPSPTVPREMGAIMVYDRGANGWTLTQKIIPTMPTTDVTVS